MKKNMLFGVLFSFVLLFVVGCTAQSTIEETQKKEGDTQLIDSSSWISLRDQESHNLKTYTLGNTAREIQNNISSRIEIKHLFVDEIPIYEMSPKDASFAKMVIFLHGQYSRKEEYLSDMVHFAENGYCCVSIDLLCHGERISSTAVMSLEITKKTASDIDSVLDYYRSCNMANADEIALIGFSQGGSVAYYYTAYGEVIPKAIVVGSTTPDYTYFVEDISIKDGKMYETLWTEEEINQFIENNNPINNISRFYSVPIMSGNNTKDPKISYKGSESFELLLHNTNHELKFYYYDSSNHDVPESFVHKILPFIKEYL